MPTLNATEPQHPAADHTVTLTGHIDGKSPGGTWLVFVEYRYRALRTVADCRDTSIGKAQVSHHNGT